MLDPMELGQLRDKIRYEPDYKLDMLKDDLIMHGEWQAVEEITREKTRRANRRLDDQLAREQAAEQYPNSTNLEPSSDSEDQDEDHKCIVCGQSSEIPLFCFECHLTKTSKECQKCGENLTKVEVYGFLENDICTMCIRDE